MKNQKQTIAVIDGLGRLEQAAVDLQTSQKEAVDRPRLYRVMHAPQRQPEDIEMCRSLSQWLCRHYLGGLGD